MAYTKTPMANVKVSTVAKPKAMPGKPMGSKPVKSSAPKANAAKTKSGGVWSKGKVC